MCKADTAAGRESAAETRASKPTAHCMCAEAPATAEAATGVPATEAAAAVATAATTTPTRFGNAARSSDDNCRRKCSFDCEC
jgi:hypothetical protein